MLSIPLDPNLERRLSELARDTGKTTSDLVRELLEQSIEDLEDIHLAVARLEKHQHPLTTEQARKALGLER